MTPQNNVNPYALATMWLKIFPVTVYPHPDKPGLYKKEPLIKDWNSKATRDSKQISAWQKHFPNCWWGIACGPSGLFVLDDDRGKNDKAIRSLDALEFDNGPLPATRTHRTITGGRHLLFRGKGRNSAGSLLGPGIDTRGEGGFIVAYPTADGGDLPIADAPAWLIDLAGKPSEREAASREPLVDLDGDLAVELATAYLEQAEPAIEGCGGDLTTYRTACKLRDFGVSEEVALELMLDHWNDSCSPPWTPDELAVKVANAYHYGNLPPGVANPEAVFEAVDLPDEVHATSTRQMVELIDITDELANPLEPQYLVDGLVETCTTGAVIGESTGGKSFSMVALAAAVATGTTWAGHQVDRPGTVVYFAGEGRRGLVRRFAAWERHHGIKIPKGRLYLPKVRVEFTAKGIRTVAEELAKLPEPPVLLILDTLVRYLPAGADENSAKDMMAFINGIDELRDRFGCVNALVHHTGHGAETQGRARGSSAFRAALDWEILIDKKKAQIRWGKMKDADLPKPISFSIQSVGDGAVAVYNGQVAVEGPHLTKREALGISTLTEAVESHGGEKVHLEQWREFYYRRHTGEIRAKREAFRKARTGLDEKGLISVESDFYWPNVLTATDRNNPQLYCGGASATNATPPL